ncbi:MAG: hypothetical protein WCR08_08825 [Gammaproteobacteria bacterium]
MFESFKSNVLLIEMGLDEWTQELPLQIKKLVNVGRLLSVGKPSNLVSPHFDNHYDLKHSVALEAGHPFESEEFSIDRNLYNEIRQFEGAVLKMMDRLPVFQEWVKSDLSDRRRMLFHEASFWSDYLKQNKVGAVVFPVIPHQVYDYIIYCLCKSRNIHTLIFDSTNPVVREIVGLAESIDEIGDPTLGLKIRDMFPKNSELLPPSNVLDDFWLARASMLVDQDPKALSIPKIAIRTVKNTISKLTVSNFLGRNWVKSTCQSFDELRIRIHRRHTIIRTKIELSHVQNIFDLPEKFVFFPLHVQPELAVSPLGGHFEEQVEAVRLVARYLPPGWRIVIKEHPDQAVFGHRPAGFYEKFAVIPQVSFVRVDYSVDELIKVCRAVITISSSIGRQAIIAGRPVGLLGSTWWSSAPGVFKVASNVTMQEMFAQLNTWDPPSREDLDQYVKVLQKSTFSAVLYGQPAGLNVEKLADVKKSTMLNIPMIIGSWLKLKQEIN